MRMLYESQKNPSNNVHCKRNTELIKRLHSPSSSSSSSSLLKVITGFLDLRDFWGVTKLSPPPRLLTEGFAWPETKTGKCLLHMKQNEQFFLHARLHRTLESEILLVLTSLCPGTASGGQRSARGGRRSGFSLLLILFIHLWTFHILQPSCVNRSQTFFKLLYLGLGEHGATISTHKRLDQN